MKPENILHANVDSCHNTKNVVVDISLTDKEKADIHILHLAAGRRDYDFNDVSLLVQICVDEKGEVKGYSHKDVTYYPAEQGEMYLRCSDLAPSLEQECIEFVKQNYIGKESTYDC